MPTLILARHGRTTANASGMLAGRTPGVHLDDKGREQARAAASRLEGLSLHAAISSPLVRCRETARLLVPEARVVTAHGQMNEHQLEQVMLDFSERRADVLARGLPWLVAERDGQVLGFAYANWFKPRPAYRFSAEDSIYVADAARGMGVGRKLLAELAVQAEAVGVRKLLAVIGDSANAGSIGLHRALGFTDVGVMRSVGWKFGAWRDIVLMEKTLGAGDTTSPE